MSVYFVGTEVGCWTPVDSLTYETTTANYFDGSVARCAMALQGGAATLPSVTWTSLSEGYVRYIGAPSIAGVTYSVNLLNSGGTSVLRALHSGSLIKLQYWNGAAWIDATSAFAYGEGQLNTFDVYFKVNSASGRLRSYVNNSPAADSGAIDLSSITAVNRLKVNGAGGAFLYIHQVAVADEPMIGWRIGTLYLTGAGTTNTFTSGTYADVDETVYSDADGISSSTANQIFTGACNDLDPGNFVIKAVGVYARAKCGASGPQNLQLAVRAGGTNYFSASQALDIGYTGVGAIWATNPNTSAAWTASDIAALEIGVKSIT